LRRILDSLSQKRFQRVWVAFVEFILPSLERKALDSNR
jgi:hypothetical protein